MNKHEMALRRRAGAGPLTRERMEAMARASLDWYAHCPVCGETLRGSLAELAAHKHETSN